MSFLNKVSSLYEKGKQKIKEKLNKNIQSENKHIESNQSKTQKENINLNIKLGNTNVSNNTSFKPANPKTKITPVKDKREEDIFKIETDKEFTYKIQDIDSDEEEDTTTNNNINNNNENNTVKKEYVIVDYKKSGASTEDSENEEKTLQNQTKKINNSSSTIYTVEDSNNSHALKDHQLKDNSLKNLKQNEVLSGFSKTEEEEENEFLKYEQEDIFNYSHKLLLKVRIILFIYFIFLNINKHFLIMFLLKIISLLKGFFN